MAKKIPAPADPNPQPEGVAAPRAADPTRHIPTMELYERLRRDVRDTVARDFHHGLAWRTDMAGLAWLAVALRRIALGESLDELIAERAAAAAAAEGDAP